MGPIFNIFFLNKVAVGPLNSVVNSGEQCYLSQKAENVWKNKKKQKRRKTQTQKRVMDPNTHVVG